MDEVEDSDVRITPRSLATIEIEQLFGVFTYDLHAKKDANNLLILYGDNGSGKTTILECIYHLLSPAPNEGHRSYLATVQFRRLSVLFTGGWGIHVRRSDSSKGDYSMDCIGPGDLNISTFFFNAEKKQFADEKASEYSSFLRKLNLEIFFLRADRTLKSDSHAQSRRAERNFTAHGGFHLQHLEFSDTDIENGERHSLRTAITRANDYIRQKSSRAANAGGASANSIYEDVIRKIVGSTQPLDDFLEPSKEVLEFRLQMLADRSKEFARFSLTAPLNATDILQTVRNAPATSLPLIASVLEPYLDSVTARLDALNSTQTLIASLVEDVNSFFTNKQIRFRLSSGLQIITPNGGVLSPDLLSSGEKHLLLMFCHTVVAHGKRTLFIIDEPELSLNVKWQQRIVDRLLDLVKDSPTQFIFATHSIELLSQQLDNTLRLIPTASVYEGQNG